MKTSSIKRRPKERKVNDYKGRKRVIHMPTYLVNLGYRKADRVKDCADILQFTRNEGRLKLASDMVLLTFLPGM